MASRKRHADEDGYEPHNAGAKIQKLGNDPASENQVSGAQVAARNRRMKLLLEESRRPVVWSPEDEVESSMVLSVLERFKEGLAKIGPKEQCLLVKAAPAEVAMPPQIDADVVAALMQKRQEQGGSRAISNDELKNVLFVVQMGESFSCKVKFTEPVVHIVNQALWTRQQLFSPSQKLPHSGNPCKGFVMAFQNCSRKRTLSRQCSWRRQSKRYPC